MLSIYDSQDYRAFINDWITSQPKSHGLKTKMAEALNVSSTLVSLILKGEKDLTLEQAIDAAEFLGLNEAETDHFFLLVEMEKAGTQKLKARFRKKLETARKQAQTLASRVKKDLTLDDQTKAVFYSSWLYAAIRNLTAVDEYQSLEAIAKRMALPKPVVARIVDFLIEHQLCKRDGQKITYGPAFTHVAADSPYVSKHHQNWRVQGMTKMDLAAENNFFFTGPMSLSAEVAAEVRSLLLTTIDQTVKKVGPSPSEKVVCLNIDWFEY